jgi:hypothetical protein
MKNIAILSLVLLSISVPISAAVLTYDVNFTRTGGDLPFIPTASFTYDDTLGQFVSFQVSWSVYSMDLTARANALGATAAGYSCGGIAPSKLYTFLISGVNDCSPLLGRYFAAYQVMPSGDAFVFYSDNTNGEFAGIRQDDYVQLDSTLNSSGTFTTTLVSAPEPTSAAPLAFAFTALAGCWMLTKRI